MRWLLSLLLHRRQLIVWRPDMDFVNANPRWEGRLTERGWEERFDDSEWRPLVRPRG